MFRVRKSAATRRTQSSRYGTEKFTPIPGTKYFSSAAGLQTGPGTTFIECLMTQHQYKPLYSCCDPVFSGFFFPTNKRFPNFGMDIESRRCRQARWVVSSLSKMSYLPIEVDECKESTVTTTSPSDPYHTSTLHKM